MNLLRALAVSLVVFSPRLAEACTVCIGGESENRTEFIIATAFMTFLPLLLVGGLIYGLRRRIQRLEREQADFASDPHALRR